MRFDMTGFHLSDILECGDVRTKGLIENMQERMLRIRRTGALSNKYDERLNVFICMRATKYKANPFSSRLHR